MDDLIAWLRAVLDEGEAEARYFLEAWDTAPDADDTAIGHHRFLLADIAAKRAILDNATGDGEIRDLEYGEIKGLLVAVRLLASAYAHRSGYREEWLP